MSTPISFPIQSKKIKTEEEVVASIDKIATKIGRRLAKDNPIIISIMNGGLIFSAELIKRFNFPMQQDYLHASRYQNKLQGASLQWFAEPTISMQGRNVLLVDDIFDEGYTLQDVHQYCEKQGANNILSAVLIKKSKSRDIHYVPDFFAMTAADEYLFGMGMDYKGYWRNTKSIYAIQNET